MQKEKVIEIIKFILSISWGIYAISLPYIICKITGCIVLIVLSIFMTLSILNYIEDKKRKKLEKQKKDMERTYITIKKIIINELINNNTEIKLTPKAFMAKYN